MSYATSQRYHLAKHLLLLQDHLMDVAVGKIPRLMIFTPPRHAKSTLVSQFFTAWFLGSMARLNQRIILASYEAHFAATWGAKARDVLLEHGEDLWGIRLRDTASNHWSIAGTETEMWTSGVGGAITGKGANILIIDDPVKNSKEALSETYRNSTWDWFRSTANTRLEPDGRVVLIQTRWHDDDLAGRILQMAGGLEDEDRKPWAVLNLPAICEDDTLEVEQQLGRTKGEALWPARFDEQALSDIKTMSGPYWWSAMYQGRPAPIEGGTFKREHFKRFTERDEYYVLSDGKLFSKSACWRFATVDLAASEKKSADYTCVAVFAVTPEKHLLLIHLHRERLVGPDQPKLFRRIYQEFHPSYLAVEKTGMQLTMVQMLQREGLPVKGLQADTDKIARAIEAGVQYENGKIYHLQGANWLDDLEEELILFPNGAHDDQVDVVAYAALELAFGGMVVRKRLGGA